jgi:protein-tyrosine phosphatase/arsenate reductase
LAAAGFNIVKTSDTNNPVYKVYYAEDACTTCFSKLYNDAENPSQNFAAIMTCSDAEENCPFIPQCDLRISTTYNDPKAFDGTLLQTEKYTERSNQIAMECLFVFSKLSGK